MIKPTELRLNNYLHDNEGRLCKVTKIGGDLDFNPRGFEALAINRPSTALLNKAIPLTEEWLIKFGFEQAYDSKFTRRLDYDKDNRFDWLINKQRKDLSGLRFKGNTFYKEVKHVHQLQNLYFALTGKELTIEK